MKKVYFACSIAGGRDYVHLYADIVGYIKSTGASLLSEMFAQKELIPEVGMTMDPAFVWDRDIKWIKESDVMIVEVTQPSLGVGYEIAIAEGYKKPILALFYETSGRRLSPMIAGNPHVLVIHYHDVKELKKAITKFIKS